MVHLFIITLTLSHVLVRVYLKRLGLIDHITSFGKLIPHLVDYPIRCQMSTGYSKMIVLMKSSSA